MRSTVTFEEALSHFEQAVASHYSTGDYVGLGIDIQEIEQEIRYALQFAEAHELLFVRRT